jgi:hypothetical protein
MSRKFFNSELSRRINNARRVYREVPFYFLVDEKPRRGRVDLVLDEQTGPVLFDYKHANKEEDLLQYKDQIERYAKVVERRFGTAPTEKFFVLLPRVELVKV